MRTLLAALALFAGTTTAGPIVDEAASELRRDPVYVHPDADVDISDAEIGDLREAIVDGDEPIFIAVLPDAAEAESAEGRVGLPRVLRDAVGVSGTFAVATSGGFYATSTDVADAASIATNAVNDHRSAGAAAVMAAFVADVQGGGSGDGDGDGGSSSGGGGLLPWLLVGGAVGGGLYLMRKSNKRRQQEQAVLIGDQEDLRAELAVLADDVMRLEPEVELEPEARDDYEAGVARFRWAQAAIDSIDSPDDVPRVRRGMAEAHYAMARARAIIRGHEPPDPPEELQRPGPHGEPAVELDDQRHPQYAGYGGDGGGWGGGGFFGGNGLFTGLLLGQMLGGGGFGWGGGHHGGDGGGMFGGGGGDVGGGDWGGGGGGDVGGGDW